MNDRKTGMWFLDSGLVSSSAYSQILEMPYFASDGLSVTKMAVDLVRCVNKCIDQLQSACLVFAKWGGT